MGSACCVAARDRTITNGSSRNGMPRTIRYSPSWSVRRRVAGEEASIHWFSDDLGTNDRLDNKSHTTAGTAYASEDGSPLESFRNRTWHKSSPSEGYIIPQSDQSVSQITSEVKGSSETPPASEPSPMMMSSSTRSVSSSSSQPHFLQRWHNRSPGHHLLRQVSDSRIPSMKSPSLSISEEGGGSPFMLSVWSNESNRGSHVGSSDGCSLPAFNSHRERWSFDKCLEHMTSEINKYDPACPVCTFGEKKVIKLSEKALKADFRINKKSRRRVVDGDDIMFGHHKIGPIGPKMSSSSSMKSSLKRHLSFGSKGSRSLSDNNFPRKKGFFWAKSSKQ
ncbi:hypothetical protein HanRHA438_Chr12g0558371 [Helianthus annuus]|nr:hypothetical protein HanRHA438_Chr12g0558371 [Helianthus annuus]